MIDLNSAKVAIIGLGYVGLPLAVEFGKQRCTIGFDINAKRISDLLSGHDATLEVASLELSEADKLSFTADINDLRECNVYIITVPTPIDAHKRPDLRALFSASDLVGQVIRQGDVVIYESTVYPGATEEDCVPIIERVSGLKFNQGFYAGYSPERINPGDKLHRLPDIKKVTSGSTSESAEFIDALYSTIIRAGTHRAPSIKVAEAAKVIENTQRDLNIALINELAIIFNKMDINTHDVLAAAGTKWNFQAFNPGLVGGHCIGVDPYYLTHKAEAIGYHPEIILAGRRLNDKMGAYVAVQMIKAMLKNRIHVNGSKVLIMGFTFKENCPDMRNTRVIDVVTELVEYGVHVDVYDPWLDQDEVQKHYDISQVDKPKANEYEGIIVAVGHDQFQEIGIDRIREYGKADHILYDLKNVFDATCSDLSL